MLLLHCFGDSLLGGSFSAIGGFSSVRSRLGFVDGVEERPVAVSIWPKTAWAGHTKGPKLITRCFLLQY